MKFSPKISKFMMITFVIFNSHFSLVSLCQKFICYKKPFSFCTNSNFSILGPNAYAKKILSPHIVPNWASFWCFTRFNFIWPRVDYMSTLWIKYWFNQMRFILAFDQIVWNWISIHVHESKITLKSSYVYLY
jgi:hypothetical protein